LSKIEIFQKRYQKIISAAAPLTLRDPDGLTLNAAFS